jgi:hypothetical protein
MRILLAVLALLVAPALVEAQSGVQWTRARDATLVSKDVGAERWAITYRLADGHVFGNVFRSDGGPPSFLDCDRTSVTDTDATFTCYGADACGGAPCPTSQYTLIAADISLPLSFFFPPGDGPGGTGTVADLIGTWSFTVDAVGGGTDVLTYHFDQLEDDGKTAVGKEQGSGDDIVAMQSGTQFEMFDRETVNCRRYVFDFVGLDRLEGEQSFTVRVPFSDHCGSFNVGGSQQFFAERVES